MITVTADDFSPEKVNDILYGGLDMDEDDVSLPDSLVESGALTPDQFSSFSSDKSRAALQIYLDSVPYSCESEEEMQAKLEYIVGKIIVCVQTQNWLVLTTWDGMIQCWLLLRYPMPKATRAKLVRLYYDLCLVPGLEARVIRSWADMLSRLLSKKQGLKLKLESSDLELPWQPLWRVLQRELWPKKRLFNSSRNMVNVLLYVAEKCKRYYPASEIPNMLSTFLPLLTKDSILVMIPVLVSFLPPTRTHLYLPPLFKLWEAFNSSMIDERLLDLVGDLSEEYVSGEAGPQGGAAWKDIGIWTEAEWILLMGKGLASMNVPVGALGISNTTAAHADSFDRQSVKIKKTVNRYYAIAKLFVYSMAVDGPVRGDSGSTPVTTHSSFAQQPGFLAGSKALDSLDRLVTSTESFFHPSNAGPWTMALTGLLQRLTSEFCKRWKEEELPACKTPITHRLTPAIRRAFVISLRTPALLAMFSKDPISMAYAQSALRSMAFLEPNLIMPELLERAYGGLEVVNETHRTTAVLSMLSGISLPLVSERIWLGGQKHVIPLLELCIPGIDLNDPIKTIYSTMFIVSTIQHIKIGDLSIHQSGVPFSSDTGGEIVEVDDETRLPDGTEGSFSILSRDEERTLVRESTAGFADWVTSLFRRVLALYENLPEEGGRKNTTGGQQEETVLKSIKNMLDIVCLHLSDQLFDLVLKLVYDYATTNARSNAVKAFGQLVACLARVRPQQTIDKFLPFCLGQIQEELKHGASSIRTTSPHEAVPSDTTLHWNMVILRGSLGCDGAAPSLIKHKSEVMRLLILLIDKTKSERGYSGTGRLISRIMDVLSGVYPLNNRFVNTEEWNDPAFDKDHNTHWGQLYEAQDVKIEWHVPSSEDIAFVLEILDQIGESILDKIDSLLEDPGKWDNIARNDFCRYLHAVRSMWSGLPTLLKEHPTNSGASLDYEDIECEGLLVAHLDVQAGFALTDNEDLRYQRALAHRVRYGNVIHRAASVLGKRTEGEDHIDAVLSVAKAIDIFLLEYGLSRAGLDRLQKIFYQARDMNRMWPKQKSNSRYVFLKRAQVYHSGRVYMDALYRRRSSMDDQLLEDLIELSLSPYSRIRRHSQAVLFNVCSSYVRSTRFALPLLFNALARGSDPDRMKGALHVLWSKGIAAYAISDRGFQKQYLLSLLECQHEEKPSIQKLVGSLAQDCLVYLAEEVAHTATFSAKVDHLEETISALQAEFSPSIVDQDLLAEAFQKTPARIARGNEEHNATISSILEVATRPKTHWRYVQMATRFLFGLLRRESAATADLAKFFAENTISPQPTIRTYAQRAVVKLLAFVKIRTFAETHEELWLNEWKNPLQRDVPVDDPSQFLKRFSSGKRDTELFVDKIPTGFIAWTASVKAYVPVNGDKSYFSWEESSLPSLNAIAEVFRKEDYFSKLALLWGQESNRQSTTADLREENLTYIKSLAKMFDLEAFNNLLTVADPLLFDSDRFKQRASAEFLAGLLRGSKHWPAQWKSKLWSWTFARLNRIFAQVKPDTLASWETFFAFQLSDRDPRRIQPLVDWILALPLEFNNDSAFEMSKSLAIFGVLLDNLGMRFNSSSDKYVKLLLENANTSYAEIRTNITQNLITLTRNLWQPWYASVDAFVQACRESNDPMRIREAPYLSQIQDIQRHFPKWKEERLAPPRVSQSQYDKVGLTLTQWVWISAHGGEASLILPYAMTILPDVLQMSELNDNVDLQGHSTAVMYIIPAITPTAENIDVILSIFVDAIKSSTSWRIRLRALPALLVFFYRNLLSITPDGVNKVMDVLLDCLSDENVEVREMASSTLAGVVRCSQRQSIIPLKNRFIALARKAKLPARSHPDYAKTLRTLHSAILGLCALIQSFPYSVERWMPSLTEILAPHATDPPPISTTIRKCASEFKKTHQDTWHNDQHAFNEDQIQSLSTMLVGTSYYA